MIVLRCSRGKKKTPNLSSRKPVKCDSMDRKEFSILAQGHLTLPVAVGFMILKSLKHTA